jgi:hypothetical protein
VPDDDWRWSRARAHLTSRADDGRGSDCARGEPYPARGDGGGVARAFVSAATPT